MSYTIPKTVNPNKIFLTPKSETIRRWDPLYFIPSVVALENKIRSVTPHRLRDFVLHMAGGATPSTTQADIHYTENSDGVPFIRVQNLSTTGKLDLEDCKRITRNTHNGLLARSRLTGGELLVKITGVGRMAVSSVVPEDFEGNINQHIVAIRTTNIETSETLAAYLNLDIAERLASRRATGGTRPALDYPALLSIPVIFNERIRKLFGAAVKQYEEKCNKALALLNNIDGILLTELGIVLNPEPANMIANRIFFRSLSEVTGNRLDPAYFDARFSRLLAAIQKSDHELIPLGKACSFLSNGKTPAKEEYSDKPTLYPIIKVASYSGDTIDLEKTDFAILPQPYIVHKSDIFVLSAAHQPSYVGRFVKQLDEEPDQPTSFVGELICLRPNPSILIPYYLFALLSSSVFQSLLNREKRGQTSHIYPYDIRQIMIPRPKFEVQQRIAEGVRQIRSKAKDLRQQGEAELYEAKRSIENIILGQGDN